MLFKLSVKNIRKSMKDYAIYFLTLILGIAVFYIFNAIESQTISLNISAHARLIIRMMNSIFSVVSVVVLIVLGFLIIYANQFLVKRRKKEFGLYLTLGMGKRKVSLILFFETILIGIISLFVGLVIGIILSQFMSLFVANMFKTTMSRFIFTFSGTAMVKTIIYFSVMYILVMIFNTQQISRCKLIDLLYADKKSEKIKIKNSVVCTIIFLIGCVILGYAYYEAVVGIKDWNNSKDFYVTVILGAIATVLIFWSLSGMVHRIVMDRRELYFKKLNSFIFRQTVSKINTMVFSMSIICLMLFFTICILSSGMSAKGYINSNVNKLPTADIQIIKDYHVSKESIKETLRKLGYDVDEMLKDMKSYNIYQIKDLTFEQSFGYSLTEARYDYMSVFSSNGNRPIECIKLSEYNRMAKQFGMDTYALNENEYVVINYEERDMQARDIALGNGESIQIDGKKYYPKYKKCKMVILSNLLFGSEYYIVPDSAKLDTIVYKYLLANYNTKDYEKQERIGEDLEKICRSEEELWFENLKNREEEKVGLGAMVTFVSLYIGIIFLISSAAVLALKELSESSDNRERYSILRKIGTDEKMINRALLKQIAIFFMFPLILAVIHSYFGIQCCNIILGDMGKDSAQILKSVGITTFILIVIYGGYFILTYLCSKEIIKER